MVLTPDRAPSCLYCVQRLHACACRRAQKRCVRNQKESMQNVQRTCRVSNTNRSRNPLTTLIQDRFSYGFHLRPSRICGVINLELFYTLISAFK
jgi:hypothetical protein